MVVPNSVYDKALEEHKGVQEAYLKDKIKKKVNEAYEKKSIEPLCGEVEQDGKLVEIINVEDHQIRTAIINYLREHAKSNKKEAMVYLIHIAKTAKDDGNVSYALRSAIELVDYPLKKAKKITENYNKHKRRPVIEGLSTKEGWKKLEDIK